MYGDGQKSLKDINLKLHRFIIAILLSTLYFAAIRFPSLFTELLVTIYKDARSQICN